MYENVIKAEDKIFATLTKQQQKWMGASTPNRKRFIIWYKIYKDEEGEPCALGKLYDAGKMKNGIKGDVLFSILIRPDYQGKGYGSRILKEALEFFNKNDKYQSFTYVVYKDNKASIALAEKGGLTRLPDEAVIPSMRKIEYVYLLDKTGVISAYDKEFKVAKTGDVSLEGYHYPDDTRIEDDDTRRDNYLTRLKRYDYARGPAEDLRTKPDEPSEDDNIFKKIRGTEDVLKYIPKFMTLPIYGFKNPDYHSFVVTEHYIDLFKNIKWTGNTFLYAYGLKSTIKDFLGLNGDSELVPTTLLLWKIFRSMEIVSSTLTKLGYLRSVHFYGVQPGFHKQGFTEFRDNKLNSFLSSDFHTVLNPYEYIIFNHPVHATESGEVIEIVNDYRDEPKAFTDIKFDNFNPFEKLKDYCGNKIVIKHNSLIRTVYANIKRDSFMVREGDFVKKGQMICRVGCSGMFRNPFLLFMIRSGDLNVPLLGTKFKLPFSAVTNKIPFVPNMWQTHFACNLMSIDEFHGKKIEDFYRRFDSSNRNGKFKYEHNGTILRDCSLVRQFPVIMVE